MNLYFCLFRSRDRIDAMLYCCFDRSRGNKIDMFFCLQLVMREIKCRCHVTAACQNRAPLEI